MKTFHAKYRSKCHECARTIEVDDLMAWDSDNRWGFHPECEPEVDNFKVGPFSAKTDGYRKPEKMPEELADSLGFDKNGDLK